MRLLDIIASLAGLIFLSPLFFLISLFIKISSKGPVLYKALRIGKDEKPFRLYKFRSMYVDADKTGPGITASGDSRITSVGRFLRKTKLDELPQLINVLKGEMSLIGPRPEDPHYIALYSPEQQEILKVKPGIASAASLTYRYEEQILSGPDWEEIYINKVMPDKLSIDLEYMSKRTFWTDISLIFQAIVSMFTPNQQFLQLILIDSIGIVSAFLISLMFRFDSSIPTEEWHNFILIIPLTILLYCAVNVLFGLYAHIWRYANAYEVVTIISSTVTSTAILLFIILIISTPRLFPISVIILGGLLTTIAFIVNRYRQRLLTGILGRLQPITGNPNRKIILIVGAGESGQALARQIQTSDKYQYELAGFVDDDPKKLGLRVQGATILGPRHSIPALVAERKISLIVIAIHHISGLELQDILSICMKINTRVKILPDFLGNISNYNQALPLKDITPEDLLGREPHQIDEKACNELVSGKVVLVTGAAGSIGSELCRQLLNFQPKQLLILDNNETGIHDLSITFKHQSRKSNLATSIQQGLTKVIPIVSDISHQAKISRIFETYRPQIVFHAAAYKHVPLMEEYPDEAVKTNVLGTKTVANAAALYNTEQFVLISTDKAIEPSSIMGITKQLSEMLIMSGAVTDKQWSTNNGHFRGLNNKPADTQQPATLFTAVRFGNVLGSRGSVVPTFTRQIEAGGPVTITHLEMTRYFMSISEAVSLVIQAATLTEGKDIFMLNMGQKIRITDLAHKMIRLRGLCPEDDIPIVYTGVRPGEKLHEQLLAPNENRLPTTHPKIFRIKNNYTMNKNDMIALISHLIELAQTQRNDELKEAIENLRKTKPITDEQASLQ